MHVSLSNPLKTRAIAGARIRTDKIGAKLPAHLPRANLVVESHVPDRQTRTRRTLLRYRASLVKTRTEIKNRIHNLLNKYGLKPDCTDIFCKKGIQWLRSLQVEAVGKIILDSDLQLLDALDGQRKDQPRDRIHRALN
jgi:transposase